LSGKTTGQALIAVVDFVNRENFVGHGVSPTIQPKVSNIVWTNEPGATPSRRWEDHDVTNLILILGDGELKREREEIEPPMAVVPLRHFGIRRRRKRRGPK